MSLNDTGHINTVLCKAKRYGFTDCVLGTPGTVWRTVIEQPEWDLYCGKRNSL